MAKPAADETQEKSPAQLTSIPAVAFGKYRLAARLGSGGMAEVLLAVAAGPAGFRKLVVIKRLHARLRDNPTFVRMFLDEARLAARLNHPNVVQTHEVDIIGGSPFLAMEHIEGESLERLLRRRRRAGSPMPIEFALLIVAEALEGLQYAHELRDFDGRPLNVVHRDVSPANIMVTYEGSVKVVDFGIAKATTHLSDTDPGIRKGKLAYVAPEQAHGTFDRRSDLFGMGVVLWEMLANRTLFQDADNAATLRNTLSGVIPSLGAVRPEITFPEGIEAAVRRALERDPDRRYRTAIEMRSDLDAVLTRMGRSVRRHDLAAYMREQFADVRATQDAAIRRCVEAAVSGVEDRPLPQRAPRLPEDRSGEAALTREPRRSRAGLVVVIAGLFGVIAGLALLLWGRSQRPPRLQAAAPLAAASAVANDRVDGDPAGRDEAAPRAMREGAGEPQPGQELPPLPEAATERSAEAFARFRSEALEHFRNERYQAAADAYHKATQANPAHAGCFAGLGASLLALDSVEEAVVAYQEAVRLSPTTSGFHAALGRAYLRAGHRTLALESYQRAVDLDPGNPAAQRGLSEASGG